MGVIAVAGISNVTKILKKLHREALSLKLKLLQSTVQMSFDCSAPDSGWMLQSHSFIIMSELFFTKFFYVLDLVQLLNSRDIE